MAEDSFETDGVRYFVTKGFISVPYMCPVLYPATRVITVPEMTWLSWAGWHRRQEGARGSRIFVVPFFFFFFFCRCAQPSAAITSSLSFFALLPPIYL